MKRFTNLFRIVIGIFVIFLVSSCASPTVITSTWEKNDLVQDYDNIMVVALTATEESRTVLEHKLVEELQEEKDVQAKPGSGTLPPRLVNNNDEKAKILDNIKAEGIDGVLTVAVIGQDTETRYVPTSAMYNPKGLYPYYGTLWNYYDYVYPQLEGYYTLNKIFFIESNLYDAQSEELVWSAQSETYSPADLEVFAEDFADEIVDQLNDQDIIK